MRTRSCAAFRLVAGALLLLGTERAALAQGVVFNPATGHFYEAVAGSITWHDAKTAAEARVFNGLRGHLVTIADAAEDDWVYYTLKGSALGDYWIGLWQDPGDVNFSEPNGGWKWVTGETATYLNWGSGEPNDAGGNEEWAGYASGFRWNDYRTDDGAVDGYVVEYASSIGVNYCQSTANSTGDAARIHAGGSASIAANDFTLLAAPLPEEAGLFLYGTSQVQLPFGNGWRCVAGALHLLHPAQRAIGFLLVRPVDYDHLPPGGAIAAGSTWNFQAWFRDVTAGGSYFNTSDGISITFVP